MPDTALVTGGAGFLGTALRRSAGECDRSRCVYTYHEWPPGPGARDFHRLDIADEAAVRTLFQEQRPQLVIHAAATMNPEHFARSIVLGSATVARMAEEIGATLIHVSTDMVFDGTRAPYDESAVPAPITDYGRAKARAEEEVVRGCSDVLIVRTSLLYSLLPVDPRTQRDIERLQHGREVTLFTDERRSAAEVHDVARALWALAGELEERPRNRGGDPYSQIVNVAGPEAVTRWQLGTALFDALGVARRHLRASTIAESGLTRPRDLTLQRTRPLPGAARIRSLSEVLGEFHAHRG